MNHLSEAYIEYEGLDIARNQLMLIMAEYRDTDCNFDDIDNRLHDATADYILSSLIGMDHQDKTDWMVTEALARRHGLSLLGYDIDADLSDEAYADKYRAYISGEMKEATAITVADMLFKDIFAERDMFNHHIQTRESSTSIS